jgi:hypothetical protein
MPQPIKSWPELNTEVRDMQDSIISRLKAVYYMYLSAVSEVEQLKNEIELLKKQIPIKSKKGKL